MSEYASVERIKSLKQGIEAKTGGSYATLTEGVQALADGYGVGSAPVLTNLEITKNGEYTPPDGVDGFWKVTANVAGTILNSPAFIGRMTFIDENVYTITDDRYVAGKALSFMEEFCNDAVNQLICYECEITNNTATESAGNYHLQFGNTNYSRGHDGAKSIFFALNIRDETNIWNTWSGLYYDPSGNVILASTEPKDRGFKITAGATVTVRRYAMFWE